MLALVFDFASYAPNWLSVPGVVTAIVFLVSGVLLVAHERSSRDSLAFLFNTVAGTLWFLCGAIALSSTVPAVALWWWRSAHAILAIVPAGLMHFASRLLPESANERRARVAIRELALLFAGLSVLTDFPVAGVTVSGFGPVPAYGWYGFVYVAYVSLPIAWTARGFVRQSRVAGSEARPRFYLLGTAFVCGVISLVDLLPGLGYAIYPFGWIGAILATPLAVWSLWKPFLRGITPELAAEQILATMHGAVVVTDVDGRIRLVNRTFLRLLGYQEEDLVGKAARETVGVLPGMDDGFGRDTTSWSIRDKSHTWTTREGRRVDVSVSASLLRDKLGLPIGIVYVALDVTERRQIMDALSQAARDYRGLFEGAHDAIVIFDPEDERVLQVNARACELYGFPEERFVGMSLLEISIEDQPGREQVVALLAGAEFVRFETVQKRSDGEPMNLDVIASIVEFMGRRAVLSVNRDIGDRKRAEEALRRSEEKYRDLFENANDLIYTHDLQGRLTSLNKAAETITGHRREDVLGRPIEDILAPESVERAREAMTSKLEGRELATSYEVEILSARGERVPLEVNTRLIWENGRPVAIQGVARDISERRKAEAAQKQIVSLLRSTLESTADGILVVDIHGRILSYNQRFAQMWNLPESILSRLSDVDAIDYVLDQLREPESFVAKVRELYERNESESLDVIRFKDGRVFERFSLPQRVDGRAAGRVWSFRDVTERERAAEALRQSEERYRLLFERNLAGVYRNTLDGKILDCNDACARLFGYASREEFLRHQATDVYFDPDERRRLIDLLMTQKSITNLEVQFRRRDGEPVWILENVSLVEDENGQPAYLEGTIIDITDRKRAQQQIEHQAFHDALTGLPNRLLFKDRLSVALGHAHRARRLVAVMFLDLDHFKDVNDTLGHSGGDELLRVIAQRLRTCVREEDTISRMGGDEFTILLADVSTEEDACKIADKVLEAVAEPAMIAGREVRGSTSIGIALYPTDGADSESLLKNADAAMYRAKEAGRGNFQLCTPALTDRVQRQLALERDLRHALGRGELQLMYQPIARLSDGVIDAVEALLRWQHPSRGLLDPGEFLSTANETRVIQQIGEWVLREVCAEGFRLQAAGHESLRIAVNFSARQYHWPEFATMVRHVLQETGYPPSMLDFEIPEIAAVQNAEVTAEVARELKSLGIGLSLDDFGAARSSLMFLRKFPLTSVKLDRAVVGAATGSSGDATVATTLIRVAHSFGLNVIAKGLETAEQLAFLRDRHADRGQGYLISPPIPPSQLAGQLSLRAFR